MADEMGSPQETDFEHPEGGRLYQCLLEAIDEAGGAIPFVQFMDMALYHPRYGYYTGGTAQFGAGGDFVTAPEISPLLAHSLARQLAAVLEQIGGGAVVEVGAGTGQLAADLLRCLPRETPLTEYCILELGAGLAERQKRKLARLVPHELARMHWIEALPEPGFRGVILANELLDAIAVNRFEMTPHGPAEIYVARDGARLVERLGAPAAAGLTEALEDLALPPGYCSEVGLRARAWVSSAAALIDRGALLLIDYGYPRHEFYHPQRARGTLMCHYRHRAHADPYVHIGAQDITAHVDFSAVAAAALEAGLELAGFSTQAGFILDAGGLETLARDTPADSFAALRATQAAKQLLLPGQMGEVFKVLLAGRSIGARQPGFAAMDQRHRL